MSVLAVLPALLTALAIGVVWLTDVLLARDILEFIIAFPTWVLAIAWIAFPIISIALARKGERHGTLYQLRSWNAFTYKLALVLLVGEAVVISLQIF
jgi:hypothetical protein